MFQGQAWKQQASPLPMSHRPEVINGTTTLLGACWAVLFPMCPGEETTSWPHRGCTAGSVPCILCDPLCCLTSSSLGFLVVNGANNTGFIILKFT